MLEIFLAIFPGSLLAHCWRESCSISRLIKESSSYTSPKNLSSTLWCTRETQHTRLSGTASPFMFHAYTACVEEPQIQYCPTESVSLAQEEQAIGHYVLKLLWFWRSKYRRWGDDPSKMRAAHQWDLNQTSVDVEEEEGAYNKVQHAVHAMAVKERPTKKAESVGQK